MWAGAHNSEHAHREYLLHSRYSRIRNSRLRIRIEKMNLNGHGEYNWHASRSSHQVIMEELRSMRAENASILKSVERVERGKYVNC